jgi:hypothetical protein
VRAANAPIARLPTEPICAEQSRRMTSFCGPLPYHRYTDLVSRYQPLTHQVRIGFPQVLQPTPMRLGNPPTRVTCRDNHTCATLRALRVFDRCKTREDDEPPDQQQHDDNDQNEREEHSIWAATRMPWAVLGHVNVSRPGDCQPSENTHSIPRKERITTPTPGTIFHVVPITVRDLSSVRDCRFMLYSIQAIWKKLKCACVPRVISPNWAPSCPSHR